MSRTPFMSLASASLRAHVAITVAALAVTACDATPATAPPPSGAPAPVVLALDAPPLGTLTPAGACTLPTLFAGATCERYVVSCEGLADATVSLVIAEPPAGVPVRSTVILGSGSAGASLIEKAATDPETGKNPLVTELTKLRKKGFRLVERAWQGDAPGDRGWLRGTEGPDDSACRYATLANYLASRWTDDEAFCALGFSGGSMELAMSMARWGTADILDQAVFVSGPVARFDEACIGGDLTADLCADAAASHPWECTTPPLACALGDDITLLLDGAYGGAPICSSRDPAHADTLYGDSVLGPDGVAAYPGTRLDMLLGMRDCGSGAATGGADFATRVTGRYGAAPTVVDVAGAGHTLHATVAGAAAVREVLMTGCKAP